MKKKPHQRIDVNVFKVLLKKMDWFEEKAVWTNRVLLDRIHKLNKYEVCIDGLNINKKEETERLNVKEFGYKDIEDIRITFRENVFENKTELLLYPLTVYELEDKLDLPTPKNDQSRLFLALISDAFERLKIKAENVINESDDVKTMEIYAKKNIQMAQRIFYDTRMAMEKVTKQGNRSDVFNVLVINVFVINVILYLQNMFSSFYKDKILTKKSLKTDLYESVGMDIIMEPVEEYERSEEQKEEINVCLQWNGQINVLITLIYDLMHEQLPNKRMLLETDLKSVQYVLSNFVIDKNGKPISPETVRTCLYGYRDEKRVSGMKRKDISKYKK